MNDQRITARLNHPSAASSGMRWLPDTRLAPCWADRPRANGPVFDCGEPATTDIGLCSRCYHKLFGHAAHPENGVAEATPR